MTKREKILREGLMDAIMSYLDISESSVDEVRAASAEDKAKALRGYLKFFDSVVFPVTMEGKDEIT